MTFTFLSKAVLCRMLPFKEKLCFRRTNYDSKIQNAHVFLFTSCETASFAERHRQKKYLPQVTDILLHILIQPPSCPHLILTCLSPPPPLPTWTAQPILFLLSLSSSSSFLSSSSSTLLLNQCSSDQPATSTQAQVYSLHAFHRLSYLTNWKLTCFSIDKTEQA